MPRMTEEQEVERLVMDIRAGRDIEEQWCGCMGCPQWTRSFSFGDPRNFTCECGKNCRCRCTLPAAVADREYHKSLRDRARAIAAESALLPGEKHG